MDKWAIREVVIDQYANHRNETYIERDNNDVIESNFYNPFVVILSGMRRVGKSTVFEIIKNRFDVYYWINFDDERLLDFGVDDFAKLYDIFLELYGEWWVFFFDEIQIVPGWERFVRRLHNEWKKVFITGSNADLLSMELGTYLTGRYVQIEMYPFSFKEFLKYKKLTVDTNDVSIKEKRAVIKNHFDSYLETGGLPEYVKTGEKAYLKNLYESIIYKDIIVRYNLVKTEKILKELLKWLYSNTSKEYSYNNLKNMLWLSNAVTIKEYVQFFENSYLLFSIYKFDYSLRKQLLYPKKAYSIDIGFSSSISFEFSKNLGQKLENIVFLDLKRRGKEIYYHQDKGECDFVIQHGWVITEAYQVSHSLSGADTKTREVNGLLEAMTAYRLETWTLLTHDDAEEAITVDGKTIRIAPVWKWLLE